MDHCYAGEEYSKMELLCDLFMILFIPPMAVYLKVGQGRSNPVRNFLTLFFKHIFPNLDLVFQNNDFLFFFKFKNLNSFVRYIYKSYRLLALFIILIAYALLLSMNLVAARVHDLHRTMVHLLYSGMCIRGMYHF